MSSKARIFWPLLCLLVCADCSTKELVVDELTPSVPHSIVGSMLNITLVYNPGAAFGVDVRRYFGAWTRPVLVIVMVTLLAALLRFYRATAPTARVLAVGFALTCGGAIGNIVDRLRFPQGVVDFIDVGIGAHRFWTFNVADAGITVGAIILALALARDDGSSSRSLRETAAS